MSKDLATTSSAGGLSALADSLGITFDALGTVTNARLPRAKTNRDLGVFQRTDSDDPVKSISGHVLAFSNAKARWEDDYSGGEGSTPDCYAVDSPYPNGDNPQSDLCANCEWNQFGSSRKGGLGKDCTDKKNILILEHGKRIPIILQIPSLGLNAVDDFIISYTADEANPPMPLAKLTIGLKKVKSRGGQDGTAPVFTVDGFIETEDEAKRIKAAMDAFVKQFKQEAHDAATPATTSGPAMDAEVTDIVVDDENEDVPF